MVWVMNMSKESCCFEAESGKTAFLAGIVDVLSDNLSLHCVDFNDFDADVFYAPDQDISQLTDAVKKRMRSYFSLLGGLNQPEKIEALAFDHLVRVDSDPEQFMIDTVDELGKDDASRNTISEFLRELKWYLGKSVCILCPDHLPDKNIDTLGRAYMYVAWKYFFIAYEEYMVLMIFGTSE